MRCFLGFDLALDEKLSIDRWRELALPSSGSPVPAKNFHITSVFLGNVDNSQLETLCAEVDKLDLQPMQLRLDSLGYWSKPKITFLAATQVPVIIEQVTSTLSDIASRARIQIPSRKYVPHLTLTRKVTNNPPAAIIEPDFNLKLNALHLFESVSGKGGVQYPIRFSWPMNPFGRPR